METHAPAEIAPILVFLAATSLVAPAFRRAGLSAVMAFLLIGLALGPNGLHRFAGQAPWLAYLTLPDGEQTEFLAELGVVFLLFTIGLEVSTERLLALRRLVFGLGTAQVVLSAAAIGAAAVAFGNALPVATVIGLAFALSSTAVVLQLLGEKRQLAGSVGRAGFSILLMQDLAVVPILFIVATFNADAPSLTQVGAALVGAAISVFLIIVIGRVVLRPLFRWVGAINSREVFVAATLLVAIGGAAAAEMAGLSMALGAFLAGLLLAGTEFRHQIETDIEPFKGLLLGLFFVTVGMQIDPALIAAQPVQILIGVGALYAVKILIIAPLARAFGLRWPRAIELGFLLGQAGEFAFVIVALARAGEVIPGATADYLLAVIALSIFITPLMAGVGVGISKLLTPRSADGPTEETAKAEGHVVVAGFGRVGQALAEILQHEHIPHIALDANAKLVAEMRKKNWPVHFGDCSRRDVLGSVGAANASAVVITLDDASAVDLIVAEVRAAWPNARIYARARDAEQARRLHQSGVTRAIPENVEASLQLGEALLSGLGLPDEAARRIIAEQREAARANMFS